MSNGLPNRIQLDIVTPERMLFSGMVDEVTVPGLGGALGILPGHAELLSELTDGVLSFSDGGKFTWFYCGPGFVEVSPESVTVLADTALPQNDIDVAQAEEERRQAEASLRSKDPETDYPGARELYHRANAKLQAARK